MHIGHSPCAFCWFWVIALCVLTHLLYKIICGIIVVTLIDEEIPTDRQLAQGHAETTSVRMVTEPWTQTS